MQSPATTDGDAERHRERERRAQAPRDAVGGDHRQHHQRRDQEDAHDPHRDGHGERGQDGDDDVEPRHRHARDAAALLVEHRGDEAAEQDGDRRERAEPEHEHRPEIVARDGEDRAEQELEEVDVEGARARDEHDPRGDAGVEDERQRLVARGAAPRAQPLDRERPDDRGDERGQHGRDPEQVAERDSGEGDVPEAVADQRRLALDEEEADGRGEQADDGARREREPHELEVKHRDVRGRGGGTGRATRPAEPAGGPS